MFVQTCTCAHIHHQFLSLMGIFMSSESLIEKEAKGFDKQVEERISSGLVPDIRRLRFVEGLYNNPWREPEFFKTQIMPKINFVVNVARQRGGRVLDVGCGMGYLALELARNGMDVEGIDISSKSIEIAQKYLDENRFTEGFGSLIYKVGNMYTMDIGKNRYDSIIFFGTLHHLERIDNVLLKVSNALKKEGNLIISEPVRSNFTLESAEFAAMLRVILPTWEPYERKLDALCSREKWRKFVKSIYNEYTYVNEKGEKVQSPLDNLISSEEVIIKSIKKYFKIKKIKRSDAFIDKIIGGLRGANRYLLARFLKFLDDDFVRHGVLPCTSIQLHAVKKP